MHVETGASHWVYRESVHARGFIGRIMYHIIYNSLFQFRFKHGQPRAKSLEDTRWEKTDFCRKFRSTKTAHDFIALWDEAVTPYLNSDGVYSPPLVRGMTDTDTLSSASGSCIGKSHPNVATSSSTDKLQKRKADKSTAGILPPTKRKKDDWDGEMKRMDEEIDIAFLGTTYLNTFLGSNLHNLN